MCSLYTNVVHRDGGVHHLVQIEISQQLQDGLP